MRRSFYNGAGRGEAGGKDGGPQAHAFTPDAAFELLCRAEKDGRLGHAYLISGPTRSGKRRLAEDVFRLVNQLPAQDADVFGSHPDAHTVEPESKSRRIVIELWIIATQNI